MKHQKIRASSIHARVSKLYLKDMAEIKKFYERKLKADISLAAAYNLARIDLLPVFNKLKQKRKGLIR